MLTLLASHPPHPSPAQRCDSSIIHFNSKINPAASNLSLHHFWFKHKLVCWSECVLMLFLDNHPFYPYLKCMHSRLRSFEMYLCATSRRHVLVLCFAELNLWACSSSSLSARMLNMQQAWNVSEGLTRSNCSGSEG